ncbi:MAG: hypothetical protein AAB403_21965, partial [Planctomycetota bacterium]
LDIDRVRQLIEMMVANDLVELSLRDGELEVNLRRPNPKSEGPVMMTVPIPIEASGIHRRRMTFGRGMARIRSILGRGGAGWSKRQRRVTAAPSISMIVAVPVIPPSTPARSFWPTLARKVVRIWMARRSWTTAVPSIRISEG